MLGPTRYYSNLLSRPRIRPADGIPAAGVLADPLIPKSIIGVAYPFSHVGGHRVGDDLTKSPEPPEVVWHLVLDRAWRDGKLTRLASKELLDGRYVLRDGEFVELAEDVA